MSDLEKAEELRRQQISALQELAKAVHESKDHLLRGIVNAHEDGLTFREIAAALGRRGTGAVYHLYMQGKEKGY